MQNRSDGQFIPTQHNLFVRECMLVVRAGKKYSNNVGTPDMAIFDWNAMFVFDFSDMTKLAKRVWFKETPS